MSNPEELALVVKAIKSGLGGCVEWDITVVDRLRKELAPHGLKLLGIRDELIKHVRASGEVVQVKEEKEYWKDLRDYYYKVIVPMPKLFKKGLFVEIELRNADPEYPEVNLVNAHEQI